MSFVIKDNDVLDKYNEIWDKIKGKLNIKFHSMPVYDEKYIKAKVREFNGVIKTNILGDKIRKENMHYICITCITIGSVIRMEKKNYPQIYLEECKYRMKKTKMTKFKEAELDSEPKSESDIELELKLRLNNCEFVLNHWLWTSWKVGSQKLSSHFANFEQPEKLNSYFTDFEWVGKWLLLRDLIKIFSWAVFIHTLWLLLYSNRPARGRKNKNTQSIFNIVFTLLVQQKYTVDF